MEFALQLTGLPASPAVLSHKKEAAVHGDWGLLLSCRNVGCEIRRVHQIVEKGGGGQPAWTFVPCGVWAERQTDGVRCLDIAGGVRQVREDADAFPSTTRDRFGTADRNAGAQGDRADGEGLVAQEEGESLCSQEEALTTAGPILSQGCRETAPRPLVNQSWSGLSVPLRKRVRIAPQIAPD
jgi:hypothetical protein